MKLKNYINRHNKTSRKYTICNKNNGKSLLCGIKNYKIKLKLEQSRLLKYINETENELSAFKIMNV